MNLSVKTISTTALVGCAMFMAACSTSNQPVRVAPPTQMQPQSLVDGLWVDQNGIVSSFSAGRFETRTADTNHLLAAGTYREAGGNVVEIEMTSVLRQTRSVVNCAVVAPYLLNCTPSQGSQFSLYKPSIAPPGFTLEDAPAMAAAAPTAPGTMPAQTAAQANPMGQTAPNAGNVSFSGAQMGASL